MLSFEDLIEDVKKYNPNANTRLINDAYDFGLAAHDGQIRKSGEPPYLKAENKNMTDNNSSMMLELNNIEVIYDHVILVLKGVSFNVPEGAIVALLGANGAGKSTLLNALAGQLPKRRYDGSIVLNKHYISALSSKVRAQYIAMLSQKTSVMFNYKVKDIIRMGGYCHGKKSKQQAHLLSDIAEALDLVKYIDKNYHQLSLGQQQRVQLARIIFQLLANQDPLAERWLLLDEHVANLDIYYHLY